MNSFLCVAQKSCLWHRLFDILNEPNTKTFSSPTEVLLRYFGLGTASVVGVNARTTTGGVDITRCRRGVVASHVDEMALSMMCREMCARHVVYPCLRLFCYSFPMA